MRVLAVSQSRSIFKVSHSIVVCRMSFSPFLLNSNFIYFGFGLYYEFVFAVFIAKTLYWKTNWITMRMTSYLPDVISPVSSSLEAWSLMLHRVPLALQEVGHSPGLVRGPRIQHSKHSILIYTRTSSNTNTWAETEGMRSLGWNPSQSTWKKITIFPIINTVLQCPSRKAFYWHLNSTTGPSSSWIMSSIALSSWKDFAGAIKSGISYSRFEDVQVKLGENRRICTRHEYGHVPQLLMQ